MAILSGGFLGSDDSAVSVHAQLEAAHLVRPLAALVSTDPFFFGVGSKLWSGKQGPPPFSPLFGLGGFPVQK